MVGQSALLGVPSRKYVLGVSISLLGLLGSSQSLAVSTKGNKNIFCEVFVAVKQFRCVLQVAVSLDRRALPR